MIVTKIIGAKENTSYGEGNSTFHSNGRKFLYNSKGLELLITVGVNNKKFRVQL